MILAIDAGTKKSGWALIRERDYSLVKFGKIDNEELLSMMEVLINSFPMNAVVLETTTCYGSVVGQETMDTCVWIGRFMETANKCGTEVATLPRRVIKGKICGKQNKKDKDVRAALIKRFAKFDMENGKGTKKCQDVFYGVSADMWSAIAAGVAYIDLERDKVFAQEGEENASEGS